MTASSRYPEVYAGWQHDQEAYWADAAKLIDWDRKWDHVFDPTLGNFGQWFAGGMLNTCHNALDRHVNSGRAEQTALIWDSAMEGRVVKFTYRQLRDRVAKFAGALRTLGVAKGDCVVIYMPMVPEAAIAMLACARLGAIHSVVFGGFASNEVAKRIEDATPKVIITASCSFILTRESRSLKTNLALKVSITNCSFKTKTKKSSNSQTAACAAQCVAT